MDLTKKLISGTIRTTVLIGTAAGLIAAGLYFNDISAKRTEQFKQEKIQSNYINYSSPSPFS